MARTFKGGRGSQVKDVDTREALITIEDGLREMSDSIAQISRGNIPTGGGALGTLGVTDHGALTGLGDDDHSQYLLLAGRVGGQRVLNPDTSRATLTLRQYGTTGYDTTAALKLESYTGDLWFSATQDVGGKRLEFWSPAQPAGPVWAIKQTSDLTLMLDPYGIESSVGTSKVAIAAGTGGTQTQIQFAVEPATHALAFWSNGTRTGDYIRIFDSVWGNYVGIDSGGAGRFRSVESSVPSGTRALRLLSEAGGSSGVDFLATTNAGITIQDTSVSARDIVTVLAQGTEQVPLVLKAAAAQAAGLTEWRSSSGSVLTRVSSGGSLHLASTQAFGFRNNADSAYLTALSKDTSDRLIVGETNISTIYEKPAGSTVGTWTSAGLAVTGTVSATTFSGSGASLTNIDHGGLSGLSDNDHPQYARKASTEAVTGSWTFDSEVGGVPVFQSNAAGTNNMAVLFDEGGGFSAYLAWAGSPTNDYTLFIPTTTSSSDLLLTATGSATMQYKAILMDTGSNGCYFRASGASTKRVYFKMANLAASTNNNLSFRSSGSAKTWELPDQNLTVVGKVGTADGGNLTDVNLTGQTAAIASTNLAATPGAGLYRVSCYAVCTTASGSGAPTLDVTIGWTDNGGAQTYNLVNGMTLASTGHSADPNAPMTLRVNSGSITYSTTINAASGSPQYALYLRCEAL